MMKTRTFNCEIILQSGNIHIPVTTTEKITIFGRDIYTVPMKRNDKLKELLRHWFFLVPKKVRLSICEKDNEGRIVAFYHSGVVQLRVASDALGVTA